MLNKLTKIFRSVYQFGHSICLLGLLLILLYLTEPNIQYF